MCVCVCVCVVECLCAEAYRLNKRRQVPSCEAKCFCPKTGVFIVNNITRRWSPPRRGVPRIGLGGAVQVHIL